MSNKIFKCENKKCVYNKKRYADNIKHSFGIFYKGKLYCTKCAEKLKLFEISGR